MMNPQQKMMMNVMSGPMLKHKWSNKKQGMRETFINYRMKARQGGGKKGESMAHVGYLIGQIFGGQKFRRTKIFH